MERKKETGRDIEKLSLASFLSQSQALEAQDKCGVETCLPAGRNPFVLVILSPEYSGLRMTKKKL
ncbi:MAG: hypothetical protein U9M90_00065 [Patescibacteria group bacterium]|nr:hypothetical protein [Patescibacteria group bacterium]